MSPERGSPAGCCAGMRIFQVVAEPVDGNGPPARAVVVAKDMDEALILLRKDVNFSGYRLPPAKLTPVTIDAAEVRHVLGDDAAHEKGVYGFRLLGVATASLPST